MAEISPDTIAGWISRDLIDEAYRPLLDVSSDVLRGRLAGKSPEECADLAEATLSHVVSALERLHAESLEDGVEPKFELSSDEETYYVKAVASEATRFLDSLLVLEPAEFERFCGRVLEGLGGKAKVTGKPGDGGIDFVARDLATCLPAPPGAKMTVIGQAKRYSRENLISENDLRTFVGASVRRTSDPDDGDCFRRSILAPVAFAFWTTSDFQPSAKKFARALGLWYLNGIALAQLALRLGVAAKPPDAPLIAPE